jgi:arylsulfatase A-like enzyme
VGFVSPERAEHPVRASRTLPVSGTEPKIGRTIAESTPAFTPAVRPPDGAPNVVIVVLDDTGFAQLGCFGSDIETPNIDRLAAHGLRYRCFHVTALCSPTRACILTGRNHHSVGMGFLTDLPTGFPGYSGRIPESAATLPRILRDAGYSTMAVGKWHLSPRWDLTASGPFDRWPLGLGFERYYGFPAGDTNQYSPNLIADNHYIDPPRTPEEGYHLTEDLADQAIRMIREQQHATPHTPFFVYFATGAMHAPHQAPSEWIDRYRGRFDDGWDAWRARVFERQRASGIVPADAECTERPRGVAAWDDLPDPERRLYARQMEVFAGFLSHTDHQIGRLVDALAALELLDDTLILLCSDNGASAEGGEHGSFNEHAWALGQEDDLALSLEHIDDLGGHRAYNHYSWGWAWAGNTPLRLWKRYTWLGGVRTPLIAHWPRGIPARGEIRTQFCHAIDLAPTVLDVAGIAPPTSVVGIEQQPMHGASLRATFADPATAAPRETQYFEMLGSRAIVRGRWKATTDHVSQGVPDEEQLLEGSRDFDRDRWALFDLDDDFAEAIDVSDAHPEVVAELERLWWTEAERFGVLPLDDTLTGRIVALEPSPHPLRARFIFHPDGGPIAEEATPSLAGGFELLAEVDPVRPGSEGILCAQGDWTNGWALLALDGRLAWIVNRFGVVHRVMSEREIPEGAVELRAVYERRRAGGGAVQLFADAELVGQGALTVDLPFRWQIGGARLHVGADRGFPVSDDYRVPFSFTGTVRRIVIELPHLRPADPDRIRSALASD